MSIIQPLIAVTILLFIYTLGEIISTKSKGSISSLLTISIVLLIWFGIGLPSDLITVTDFIPVGAVLIALYVVAVGSMFSVSEMKRQWKVVVITFVGVAAATALLIAVGIPLLGKDITLSGAPVFAGASTAAMIMIEALTALGKSDMSVFVILVLVLQLVVGLPMTSLLLKKAARNFIKSPDTMQLYLKPVQQCALPNQRRKPLTLPAVLNTPPATLAKLGLIAVISSFLAKLTNNVISMYIFALILGFVFTELGFLQENALDKTESAEFITILIIFALLSDLVEATPALLLQLAVPLVSMLLIGAAFCCLVGFILAKVFKMDPYLAMCICLSCTLGFPSTAIVPKEVANGVGTTEEEKAALDNYLTPKMVTAGFCCGIVSTIIAGICAGII